MRSLRAKPSISDRSWLSVCSRSSFPPPSPAPRERPTASISSMKTMAGETCLACWNKSRTRLAPIPTKSSMNSDALTEKNGTSASPATARASSVLPVPGGPTRRIPCGTFPPSRRKASGALRKSTISPRSRLAPLRPATSSNLVCTRAAVSTRDERPASNLPIGPPARAPAARRDIQTQAPRMSTHGRTDSRTRTRGDTSSLFTVTATTFSRSKGSRFLSSMAGRSDRNVVIDCPSTLSAAFSFPRIWSPVRVTDSTFPESTSV